MKGKITKVPYKLDGSKASSNKRSHFSKFESIVSHTKGYDGIGLGIFDGYSAIDIDHCIKDGNISEMAQDIINTMKSYNEVSPSGNGIRIIFKAIGLVYDKNKYYINNQKVQLEVYLTGSTSKYVPITGNALIDLDIASRTDEALMVVEKYMKKKTKLTSNLTTAQRNMKTLFQCYTAFRIDLSRINSYNLRGLKLYFKSIKRSAKCLNL